MTQLRDRPLAESTARAQQRRERLFELCHQEQRAMKSAAMTAVRGNGRLSEEELVALRERAVRSFTRPD